MSKGLVQAGTQHKSNLIAQSSHSNFGKTCYEPMVDSASSASSSVTSTSSVQAATWRGHQTSTSSTSKMLVRAPPSTPSPPSQKLGKRTGSGGGLSSHAAVAVKPRKRNAKYCKSRSSKHRPKDLPVRPLNAYNFFFSDQRMTIIKEREYQSPEKKLAGAEMFSAMGKMIASRWKQLKPEELEKYQALAEEDKLRYRREMDVYNRKKQSRLDDQWSSESAIDFDSKSGSSTKPAAISTTSFRDLQGSCTSSSDIEIGQKDFRLHEGHEGTTIQQINLQSVLDPPGYGSAFTDRYSPMQSHAMDNNIRASQVSSLVASLDHIRAAAGSAHPPQASFNVDRQSQGQSQQALASVFAQIQSSRLLGGLYDQAAATATATAASATMPPTPFGGPGSTPLPVIQTVPPLLPNMTLQDCYVRNLQCQMLQPSSSPSPSAALMEQALLHNAAATSRQQPTSTIPGLINVGPQSPIGGLPSPTRSAALMEQALLHIAAAAASCQQSASTNSGLTNVVGVQSPIALLIARQLQMQQSGQGQPNIVDMARIRDFQNQLAILTFLQQQQQHQQQQ